MAKFAEVTYGTHNDGTQKTYTYIVNDNVRSGDILQPVVKHAQSGKIFATTGIAQSTKSANPESEQGKRNIADVSKELGGKDAKTILTGREMGIQQGFSKESTGAQIGKENGVFTNKNPDSYKVTDYVKGTREGNLALSQETPVTQGALSNISSPYLNQVDKKQEQPTSSFDEYSKAFMPKK